MAAKRLVEGGLRVVVLEQGDWPDYSKARANHADFEITAGRDWSANPNRRMAPADYPICDDESDISAVLYNAVGGSSVLFAAHWQRNLPSDFRVRTLDGVGDDWPLTYEELAALPTNKSSWILASPGWPATLPFHQAKGPPCLPTFGADGAADRAPIIGSAGTGGQRRTPSPPGPIDRSPHAPSEQPACGAASRAPKGLSIERIGRSIWTLVSA